jgi:protocatechuate 3,4-dioxygenase beta subunit
LDGQGVQTARRPAEELAARLGTGSGHAGAVALAAAVRHLHALVDELRPSPDDLRHVLEFLTETGHATDDRRQEWVLLCDVLGISTHVEDLNCRRPASATPNTLAGPFYRPDAPMVAPGGTICRDGRGAELEIRGRLADTAGCPVAGAMVEIWQANGEGLYENQQPDLQPDFNLRGRLPAGADGRFVVRSVRPGGYRLPEDGPVGRLLNGLGYRLERPAHIHFRVAAPGFQTLVTHVFDDADPAIGRDALFGVKPALLGRFVPAEGPAGLAWSLDVDFILARTGETGTPTQTSGGKT